MAVKNPYEDIVASDTGDSDSIRLGEGLWVLRFKWAASAGAAALQIGWAGIFTPYLDGDGDAVSIESDMHLVVPGGVEYRVNVGTATSTLTISAACSKK